MAYKIETNLSAIDGWTLAHFGAGAIMAAIGVHPALFLLFISMWEIVENWRRPEYTIPHMSPDSNVNIIGDLISAIIGYVLVYCVKIRR